MRFASGAVCAESCGTGPSTSTTTYWIRVGAVMGLTAIALQETVDFSLQMPGNAALFAVLCGIALHTTPERRPR